MELNEKLSCAELQLTFDNICELYKSHHDDFVWVVKEDMN
jgi:hypothetical protein